MAGNVPASACCYQSVKDKNFESNSQRNGARFDSAHGCYQSVKDKNFESNSQQHASQGYKLECCYQSVKDKNFESNSQYDLLKSNRAKLFANTMNCIENLLYCLFSWVCNTTFILPHFTFIDSYILSKL